jgi:hypothetical protein
MAAHRGLIEAQLYQNNEKRPRGQPQAVMASLPDFPQAQFFRNHRSSQ